MAYSECCREKLLAYKIEGQSKPFVDDKDLQLQLPGSESQESTESPTSPSPIYSHYVGSCPSPSYTPSPINEDELYQAIHDAEQSYEAWKKMQERLKEASKAYGK